MHQSVEHDGVELFPFVNFNIDAVNGRERGKRGEPRAFARYTVWGAADKEGGVGRGEA